MVYAAQVVRVAIASPSDVSDARDAVEAALHSWNNAHGERLRVSLQPWRWETGAIPVLDGPPQSMINSQGIDRADVLIGLFGSRLGSPTPSAVSGTVEEIERTVAAGKPVHLFFSTAPLPADVDTRQLDGLRDFRHEIQSRGLYGEYHNPVELSVEVWKVIAHDLERLDLADPTPADAQPVEAPSFQVQLRSAGNGKHSIDITNRSRTLDAENVVVAQEGTWAGRIMPSWQGPTVIHAEQTRSIVAFFSLGRTEDPRAIRISWDADGESHSKVFHL